MGKPSFFKYIAEYSHISLKNTLEEATQHKILSVSPDLYHLTWELNEKTKKNELYINTFSITSASTNSTQTKPDNENNDIANIDNNDQFHKNAFKSKSRLQDFTKDVLWYLYEKHETFIKNLSNCKPDGKEFLETDKNQSSCYKYSIQKNWHDAFLNSVDLEPKSKDQKFDLALKGMPSKRQQGAKNIKKFQSSKLESELLNEEIIKKVLMKNSEVTGDKTSLPMDIFENSKDLKSSLVEIVKEKERQFKEKNLRKNYIYESWDKEHKIDQAEMIMFYYSSRKVSNMYLMNVVDHIAKTQTSFIQSKGIRFFFIK